MNNLDQMIEELSFVKRGKNRQKVMKSLDGEAKIPSAIAKDTGILQNHMSALLRQLAEYELVECINPEVRKGRLYRLTEKGKEIVKEL